MAEAIVFAWISKLFLVLPGAFICPTLSCHCRMSSTLSMPTATLGTTGWMLVHWDCSTTHPSLLMKVFTQEAEVWGTCELWLHHFPFPGFLWRATSKSPRAIICIVCVCVCACAIPLWLHSFSPSILLLPPPSRLVSCSLDPSKPGDLNEFFNATGVDNNMVREHVLCMSKCVMVGCHGHTNQFTIDSLQCYASWLFYIPTSVTMRHSYVGVMAMKHDFPFHTSLMTP